MNDEIEEMLDLINELVKISPNKGSYGISHKKWKQLLDYITNLQQAVKDTKDTADDMLYELKQENERLKELNENASKVCIAEHRYGVDKAEEARDYKSRCEKAIEYIENNMQYDDNIDDNWVMTNDLLNILQNGSENDE